jgi:hypothetical protein
VFQRSESACSIGLRACASADTLGRAGGDVHRWFDLMTAISRVDRSSDAGFRSSGTEISLDRFRRNQRMAVRRRAGWTDVRMVDQRQLICRPAK